MKPEDVKVHGGSIVWKPDATCVLTGAKCKIEPVVLRRMWLLGPYWRGQRVCLGFPLSRPRNLVLPQYLRMLAPYMAILPPLIVAGSVAEGVENRIFKSIVVAAGFLGIGGIWALIRAVLRKHEIVRFLKVNKAENSIVLRFNSADVANKVRRMADNVE